MADVADMPANAFGSVPTPAPVAPIEFTMRRKIDWIELDAASLAADIDVTDEKTSARYEESRANYVRPEQREASHILLSLEDGASDDEVAAKSAEVEAVSERLAAGESFADLASELSEDAGSAENGGSLGVIAPGAMVPEFEEAVFALENEGDVSEPVRTEFGLHLVRLDKVTPESGKPFEEVRDEVVVALRAEQADRDFFELRSELAEIVYDESASLEPTADATGLEVQSSDWLDAGTAGEAGPVLSNPAILAAANDAEVHESGNNSELIEVGPRHVVALRVTESEGSRPKTLEDVREQVIDEIRSERAARRLDELAASATEALGGTDDVASIAADEPLAEAFANETLERQSTAFDNGVVATIFALPRPADGEPRTDTATLGDGDRLAYALRSIELPDAPDEASGGDEEGVPGSAASVVAGADPRRGDVEFNALLGSLRESADVDVEP